MARRRSREGQLRRDHRSDCWGLWRLWPAVSTGAGAQAGLFVPGFLSSHSDVVVQSLSCV